MIKEKITYQDFLGEERTEEFHFNLSTAELTELQFANGGFQEYLTRIVESKDIAEILKAFKNLLRMAYGTKTADGRGFIKREEDWLAFISSEAYSILLMKLLADPEWAANFFNAMVPADLAERAAAQQRGEGIATPPRAPQDHLPKQEVRKDDIVSANQETPNLPTPVETVIKSPIETAEEMRARIRAELIAEQEAESLKNQAKMNPDQN
jgi:hypothetical protein